MKKNLFVGFIALTALTVTSCTNDEVVEAIPQKQAIEFGTYLGRDAQSRATELTTQTLANFGVYASYTLKADWNNNASNFMFNQKVELEDGVWTYNPKKYWPATQGEKISFFAYAPYYNNETSAAATVTEVTDNDDASSPKVNFAIANDVTKMVDFTAGVVMNRMKTDNNESNGENTVTFNLKHELTRVNFKAKLDRDAFVGTGDANKTKINITSVKIDEGNDFIASADYQFSSVEGNPGTWSNQVSTGEDLLLDGILAYEEPTDLGEYEELGVSIPNETDVPLFEGGEYVFLIPANNGAGLAAGDIINVTFTYDIVTADSELAGGYVKTTATKTVTLPTGNSSVTPVVQNTLKQGQAYNFTFIFGLHEVKVAAEVDNWSEETNGGEQDVDWTDTDATPTTPPAANEQPR